MKLRLLSILVVILSVASLVTANEFIFTPTAPTVGQNFTVALNGTTMINTSNTLLEVLTPTARLRLLSGQTTVALPLAFTPTETGNHTFQLIDRTLRNVLLEGNITVGDLSPENTTLPVKETPSPINHTNETNNAIENITIIEQEPVKNTTESMQNITPAVKETNNTQTNISNVTQLKDSTLILQGLNRPVRTEMRTKEKEKGFRTTRMSEFMELSGTYDVEISFTNSRTKKVRMNNCTLPQEVVLGLEDVKKRVTVQGKEAASTYAIDPSQVNFTNGTLTREATGNQVWKCVEWNFTTQTCEGEWKFLRTITPGQEYEITFNATDPGFAELNLTILNLKSYPQVGGNWSVEFTTYGTANLTITATDGTTWSDNDNTEDLEFLSLQCGDQNVPYQWIDDSVFVEDYSCNTTGSETSKVYTTGRHVIDFTFGNITKRAENYAAASGLLMLRDDTGGQSTASSTVGNNITWGAQDRVDPAFSHNSGETNITIQTSGVYRVSYGVSVRQAGGGRIEDVSRLYVNGNIHAACGAQSYTRGGTSTQDGALTSDCLVSLTSGDVVWLNTLRTSDTTTAESTVADRTWFHMQLVEDPNVFMAHDEVGGQDMDQTAGTVLTWDTQDRADSRYSFTADANNVTVLESGLYRITYGVATQHTTDVRYVPYGEILINDSQIPVGYANDFARGSNEVRDAVIVADALVELGANATVKIRGGRTSVVSESSAVTTVNRTWFQIEHIPTEDANVVMVYESGGGESLDNTGGVDIAWDTTQREDSFFNVTDANTIEVLRDGYYRIAYSVYNDRPVDPTDGTRVELLGNLRIGGADADVCWSSGYNRGDEGSGGDAYEGGQFASCLVNLSAGTDLEVRMRRSSSTSAVIENVGDRTWWYIQALDALNSPPNVSLEVPANDSIFNSATVDFNFTGTDNDSTSLTCTLYGNFTGSFLPNTTITASNGTEENITLTLNDGAYYWNVYCVDENTASDWGLENRTLRIDTAIPIITNETNTSTTDSSTVIEWDTNEAANSTVQYGETESLGSENRDNTLVLAHGIALTGLNSNTLYYYNVTSCDEAGNCNTTGPHNFTTSDQPDLTAPLITFVNATPYETTSIINWTTNEVANSTVEYGTSLSLGSFEYLGTFITDHSLTLTGLSPKVFYYYNVSSCDASGNCNTTGPHNFTTIDLTPPVTTLVFPDDGDTTGLTTNLTFNVTDNVAGNISNCTLWHNASGWQENQTRVNVTQGENQSFLVGFTPGTYTWNVYCIDAEGLESYPTNQTFTAEDEPMDITLIAPLDNSASSSLTIDFNCSVTDDYGLLSVSLFTNASGSWGLNETINVTGLSSQANFTTSFPVGSYLWNCRATDEFGQRQFASSNYTVYADNRSLDVQNSLNKTVVKPGTFLSMRGNVTLSDGSNVSDNIFNVTLGSIILNPDNASEINISERNLSHEWWNAMYKYRGQINITNQNSTDPLPSGYTINLTIDTETLTNNGLLNANGSDLRIVFWNGSKNVELARLNQTLFNETDTQVRFRLQQAIAASGTDTNYFYYYGYPEAGAPTETKHLVFSSIQVVRLTGVNEDWQEVQINDTYANPVIIADIEEPINPLEEVVSRITNITNTSFMLRLQNPGDNSFVDRNVTIFVMDSGIYTTEDGAALEARVIEDESEVVGSGTTTGTTYDTITYSQTFPGAPAVVSQVMSYKDSLWVGDHTDSITATTAGVALEMGQYCDTGGACPNAEGHDPEDLGVIVFERTSGTIDGVGYDAALTPVNINGPEDGAGCFYTAFGTTFSNRGLVAADINVRNGGDGGWSTTCGTNTTHVGLTNMEEDESDGERSHGGTESATYIAFGAEGMHAVINDFPTTPSLSTGSGELRPTKTDSFGAFNYTFNAPMTEGIYDVVVNISYIIFNSWNITQLHVDGTPPIPNITVLSPNPAEIGVDDVVVNWTVSDSYPDVEYLNVTYPNGTLLGQYFTNITLTTAQLTTRGDYNVTVFAEDQAGNVNWTNLTLVVHDTLPPTVYLNDPDNDTWVLTNTTLFNYTAIDHDDLFNCSLYTNTTGSWALNATNSSPLNNEFNYFNVSVADGTYSWNVLCYDNSSNGAFAENNFTFKVDTTPPIVQLEAPPNNTLNTSTNNLLFFFNTSDVMTDIASCIYILDDVQKGPVETGISEDTSENVTRFVANGEHNWSINCTDNNGFTGSSQTYNISVLVLSESDPPLITLNDPTVDEYVNTSTITFNYTVEDATGIENCSIYIDGTINLTNTSVDNNVPNYFTIAGLNETEHEWYVDCYDNNTFAYSAATPRNFTVDLTNPTVTLNLPGDNTFVTSPDVLFNFTPVDTNLDACTLWHNVTGWQANESNSSVVSNTPNYFSVPFEDGPYLWNVFCVDLANRSMFATSNYTVFVDTAAPVIINTTTQPESPATYDPSTTYEFNITLAEPFVDTVLLEHNISGSFMNYSLTSSSPPFYTVLITDVPAGYYEYRWYVNDSIGQTNQTSVLNYTVEKATPDINLTLNGTRNNISILDNKYVNMSASLLSPSGGYLELYLDGVLLTNGTSPIENISLFTMPGTYNVSIVYNETQNYTFGMETHYVKVNDTTAPNVTLITPVNVTTVGTDDVVFTYNVSDLGTILNCSLYINESLNLTDFGVEENELNTFQLNLPDGNYSWQVVCFDTDNQGTSELRNFTVLDSTYLNVTIVTRTPYQQGERAQLNMSTSDRFQNAIQANTTTAVIYTNTTRTVAPWWNTSFPYRKQLNITNNEITTLEEGYSILITTNTSHPNMLDNGSDVRIAYWDASNASVVEIDRFNTTPFDSSSTEIWFMLQKNVSGNATDLGYFLYYGNDTMTSPPEDTDNVFLYYSAGDISGWVNHTTTGLTQTTDPSTGEAILKTFNSDPGGGYHLLSRETVDYELIFSTNRTNENGGASNRYGLLDSSGDGYGPRHDSFGVSSGIIIEERTAYSATETIATSASVTLNQNEWFIWRTRKVGSDMNFTAFDSSGTYITSVIGTDVTHDAASLDRFQIMGGYEFLTDDIQIRRYTTLEPSSNVIGGEERLVGMFSNETSFIGGKAFEFFDTGGHSFGNYSVVSIGTRSEFENGNGSTYFELGPDITNPNVTLVSPENEPIENVSSVSFVYNVSDWTLTSCTLYGNFTGSWLQNETNNTPTNYNVNNFSITLGDGDYIWNVECNDSSGNSSFATYNFTVTVDTTPPIITLNAPVNNSNHTTPVQFNWTAQDLTHNLTCALYIDGQLNVSDIPAIRGTPVTQNVTILNPGVVEWNVTCVDAAYFSNSSTTFEFFLLNPPENLSAYITSDGTGLVVNWSAAPGANTYNLFIWNNYTAGKQGTPNATGIVDTNYTDLTASTEQQRYYWVEAVRSEATAEREAPVGKYTTTLPVNLSLVSFPLIPATSELENGTNNGFTFNMYPACLVTLWDRNDTGYRRTDWNGSEFVPSGGSESFTDLYMNMSFWFEANQTCDLTFTGTVPTENNTRALVPGFNLRSWHTIFNVTLPVNYEPVLFNVTPVNSIQALNRYNPSTNEFEVTIHYDVSGTPWGWFPSFNNQDFTKVDPTLGYSFDSTTASEWIHDPLT